jgi:hypothetical protein
MTHIVSPPWWGTMQVRGRGKVADRAVLKADAASLCSDVGHA